MKIRSITYFCHPGFPLNETILYKAGAFLTNAKSAFEAAGYDVQTVRLATTPFPKLLNGQVDRLPQLVQTLNANLPEIGVNYASLGPALIEMPNSFAVIPEALEAGDNIFFGGIMADRTQGISLAAVHACARVIEKVATLTPDGFANLRFAALANVQAGAPFFPAAYHAGEAPTFSVAVEAAGLAVEAFSSAQTLDEGRDALVSEIERHGQAIANIAKSLTGSATFTGIDFSLAPFPDDANSLGNAVEKMGVPKIGLHGSLAAAAILTEAVDRADFPHTGFGGFMQPILEDTRLAQRSAEGYLTIKDALLYSAVCGTGLDTVPLAGDVTADEIAPLLLDLCAMALRLNKPLTARLMPIPGKKVGDPTEFNFGFFANGRVMALAAESLQAPLNGNETIQLRQKLQG